MSLEPSSLRLEAPSKNVVGAFALSAFEEILACSILSFADLSAGRFCAAILSAPDGSFSDRVMLVNGSNQIKISARNKFGKESTKTIIVESTAEGIDKVTPTEVNKNKIDGVEISIEAGQQAIYINVKSDGLEVFKGTMLPGSKQLFKAKDSIKLSTGNAGNTSVTLTNSLVANKNIGTLGPEGEPKQDIIFNKDTNIQ
jgi:hypothetical protein